MALLVSAWTSTSSSASASARRSARSSVAAAAGSPRSDCIRPSCASAAASSGLVPACSSVNSTASIRRARASSSAPLPHVDVGERHAGAGCRQCVALLLLAAGSPARAVRVPRPCRAGLEGERARAHKQLGLHARLGGGESGGLVQVALRLVGGREAGRPLPRLHERGAGPQPDLADVGVFGQRVGRAQQMRGDDLRDVVVGALERLLERADRGQVARLPVAAGKGLVGDLAQELLQEAVLPALRLTRVGLQREHLLPHEAGEQRLQLRFRRPDSAASACLPKLLPSTQASCTS